LCGKQLLKMRYSRQSRRRGRGLELRTLCFDLDVKYDNLGSKTLDGKMLVNSSRGPHLVVFW